MNPAHPVVLESVYAFPRLRSMPGNIQPLAEFLDPNEVESSIEKLFLSAFEDLLVQSMEQ